MSSLHLLEVPGMYTKDMRPFPLLRMAGCFMIGELPEELRSLGHDVPDPIIVSCLSQMQLTDHSYEISTTLVTSRAANDRSSPLYCVRAGKSPRHEHGPPVPGDRDFRQEPDSIFLNCTLATELQGLKKMLRVMGETKDELLGTLNGPGAVKRRISQAEDDEDVGKLFGEWRLVGRTLRPIDNNVVAADSFKASALTQNLKSENQFFEPLVYPADENTKGDHQFYEQQVPYSTNENPEPTKPLHVGGSFKPPTNTTNTKKNHGLELQAATVLNEQLELAKSAVVEDCVVPVVSQHNKENPVSDLPAFQSANEPSEPVKSISYKAEEDRPEKQDECHAQVNDTSLSEHGVTSQTRRPDTKETQKNIEEVDTALNSKGASDRSEVEETTSTDTTVTSSDSLTNEEEDSASNLKGEQGREWMSKKTSPEYLREERILKAAIEAGASYYHDGVVYRENLVYDMLRSPSSGTQEDILESNHDLEEIQKPAPRKKSYNPELFSLSNDHFLEAFEKSLAELDPKDTIDQETFASVSRHSAEPEQFHQFNFASLSSLVNFPIEDENLLDLNSPLLISPVPATIAVPDRETADPLVNLDDPSSFLSDDSKEVNQFLLDEEALHESAEEVNQFFLQGKSPPENADDVKQALDELALTKDPFNNSVSVPTTPDQGAEVNPPSRKDRHDTSKGLAFSQVKIVEDTHKVVASAFESPIQAVSKGDGENAAPITPCSEMSDAAIGKTSAVAIKPLDDLQGTAGTCHEVLTRRSSGVESETEIRLSADHRPSNDEITTLSPPNFSLGELNESRFAGGLDHGISGHLEPLNDRSNIPTANADDHNRPRPKTITDFFNPSEMTLRRPSTIEIKKRDKETRSLFRAAEQKSIGESPVDHLRFALPPPSSRGSSRRHSLSEKSLEIAGLALTPIRVPSRDRVCPTHGASDHTHGSCSQCSLGAPKRRGESRVFGASGSRSPQVESTTHNKSGETGGPLGVAGSQSPYGKIHSGFLKKGGAGSISPGTAASSKTPQTPQSTTSSGSEASPKQNPFKRNSGIYSSLVTREKRNGDGSSVLFNTSRLSTSVNLPSSSSRMSTSVNLPSAKERSSNQRPILSRSNTESLHPPSSQRRNPAQDIKKGADSLVSRPAFNTSTVLVKSRTIASTTTTTTTKEKLTPGTARRTQSVKERASR